MRSRISRSVSAIRASAIPIIRTGRIGRIGARMTTRGARHSASALPSRRTRTTTRTQQSQPSGQQQGIKLYVYPAAGQSEAQTSEDRYQCHVWATNQTGYDPTQWRRQARGRRGLYARVHGVHGRAQLCGQVSKTRAPLGARSRSRPASRSAATAGAAIDLSQLQVTPQRGQSADQARRDRYECHNWAVEQTGEVPSAAPAPNQDAADAAKRADRIGRIATGAAIGAMRRRHIRRRPQLRRRRRSKARPSAAWSASPPAPRTTRSSRSRPAPSPAATICAR